MDRRDSDLFGRILVLSDTEREFSCYFLLDRRSQLWDSPADEASVQRCEPGPMRAYAVCPDADARVTRGVNSRSHTFTDGESAASFH